VQSGYKWSWSSLSGNRSNVQPVAVPVAPKKGKRLDWTGPDFQTLIRIH